ncbi:ABC transporter ATP-binding protein [Paracraurococcus lichenis]|uniref:ABC transporter ATP-binding protein n=1 Tax=Paracraurococcus lichenis TaxID=3064888 RepID=A0ABT9E782_9PROT|nr:ABC transporter ATP-binding protein [Paracraurococcus sp. LOR1-02]MDO9711810.1 ABC transporter ATP-binding protein [Paracraurococcus sp. LOR1-02]
MLEVSGLVSGYGRIGVLHGADLSLAEGSCVGILGHNGMGKTTLLRTVMGLLPAKAGRILLDGAEIQRLPPHARARRGLGYVPQGRQIFPALSVLDNLRFAIVAKGGDEALVLEEVLDEFPELRRLLDRPGGALSGGEQQLLALSRALCGRPRLLLLDEPTEGIQPSIVEAMIDRIHALRRKGLSVLLVEQNLDFIQALSDRILLIHRGRITREMPPAALADPALVQEFVGTHA